MSTMQIRMSAVCELVREMRRASRKTGFEPVIFFAGDDVTDEDAHRALAREPGAITVLVGKRSRPTRARQRVRDPAELRRVLAKLAWYLPGR